jgi:hypothetical protein
MVSSDWNKFCAHGWFQLNQGLFDVGPVEASTVAAFSPSSKFESIFPRLATLLRKARSTPVRIKPGSIDCFGNTTDWLAPLHYLLGWDYPGFSAGWLVVPPGLNGEFDASHKLHEHHKILLDSFGGICETWGDGNYVPSLINSYNWVFVEKECQCGFEQWKIYYEGFLEEKFENPIDCADYVEFGCEANGNAPVYHCETGRVILLATDHCFDYVTSLPGCPDRTLYSINECPDFRSWVEKLAEQWLSSTQA